jgi:hypothetical protein
LEWGRASINGGKPEAHQTPQLDEEDGIYVPQSPYPELRSSSRRVKDGPVHTRDATFDLNNFGTVNARWRDERLWDEVEDRAGSAEEV